MAERTDKLHLEGYSIIQDKNKFCYGIDAVLLADFFKSRSVFNPQGDEVFDLGTGNGIIPILIAATCPQSVHITGLELQKDVSDMALRSVELNGLSSSIKIVNGDIKNIPGIFPGHSADSVVSNPPYMIPSQGRQSSNRAKMIARQELCCTLSDVVKGAVFLLKESGHFFMVHRAQRLTEILASLLENGFNSIFYREVKPFAGEEPTMVLFDCSFSKIRGSISRLQDLIVYEKSGVYTEEVNSIYGRKSEVTEKSVCN